MSDESKSKPPTDAGAPESDPGSEAKPDTQPMKQVPTPAPSAQDVSSADTAEPAASPTPAEAASPKPAAPPPAATAATPSPPTSPAASTAAVPPKPATAPAPPADPATPKPLAAAPAAKPPVAPGAAPGAAPPAAKPAGAKPAVPGAATPAAKPAVAKPAAPGGATPAAKPAVAKPAAAKPAAPVKPAGPDPKEIKAMRDRIVAALEERKKLGEEVTVHSLAKKLTFTGNVVRIDEEEGFVVLEHVDGRRRGLFFILGGSLSTQDGQEVPFPMDGVAR